MERTARLIIFVSSFVVFSLIGELCLWLFAPVPDPYAKFKYGPESRNQYIRSEFPPGWTFITEPEPGLRGVTGPNVFSTNNMGFRGDPLIVPKPMNEFRIFLVGGSTTECLYLDDSEAINSTLQKELKKRVPGDLTIRVYGAGKSGDASDDHVSMIVHRIAQLEPDMVIVFPGINDLTRAIYYYDYLHFLKQIPKEKSPILRLLTTESQIGRRTHNLLRRFSKDDREILERISTKTDYRAKVLLRESAPASDERPRTEIASYTNNLKTIIGVAAAHNFHLVFITQQTTWNSAVDQEAKNWHWMLYRNGVTYREDLMNEALESLNDGVRQLAAKNSVPLYDLARSMPKSLEFFYDDVHFNEKGAVTAGQELASLILQCELISPTPHSRGSLEPVQENRTEVTVVGTQTQKPDP